MVKGLIVAALTFGVLGAFQSFAQVADIDFSKRSTEFENKMLEMSVDKPEASSRWMTRQFRTTRYSASEYRAADRKFAVERMDLFKSNRYRTEELDLEMRDTEMFRNNSQLFSADELDRIRFNTLHHDVKKESQVADAGAAVEIEEYLDRLSLADINRYQFRRSRSRETGFPVQQAAAGETEE